MLLPQPGLSSFRKELQELQIISTCWIRYSKLRTLKTLAFNWHVSQQFPHHPRIILHSTSGPSKHPPNGLFFSTRSTLSSAIQHGSDSCPSTPFLPPREATAGGIEALSHSLQSSAHEARRLQRWTSSAGDDCSASSPRTRLLWLGMNSSRWRSIRSSLDGGICVSQHSLLFCDKRMTFVGLGFISP